MAEPDGDTLGRADAARVLRLSAQLQAEAGGSAAVPAVPAAREDRPLSGYPLARIRAAARDAGIADTYVDAALADAIVAAMQAVLPGEPYRLTLRDREGDPQQGGALLFDLPRMKTPFEQGFAHEVNEVGLRHLLVSLRVVEGNTPTCELTVHSAVTAHNTGFTVGMVLTTFGGVLGAGALGALGLALGGALGLGGVLAPVAGVGGGLLGGLSGLKGFRGIYRFAVRRARGAIEGMVGAVAARAEGAW